MKSNKRIQWFLMLFTIIIAFCAIHPLLIAEQSADMKVNVRVEPGSVTPNQQTEILVEAYSSDSTPVSNAYVVITAIGGQFKDSKDTTTEGKTDANGSFSAWWQCNECSESYTFTVEVLKPGFKNWKGEVKVNITASEIKNQSKEIFGTINLDPMIASENQPVLLIIETFSDQGTPIKNGEVNITASGGIFIDTGKADISGETNNYGTYETTWKCIDCEEGYEFKIQVNKDGLTGWNGEARLLTGEQPLPLKKGGISVKATIDPSTAAKGQNVEIRIEAFSDRGDTVPDANVRISTEGGSFTKSKNEIMEGITDENGFFSATWNCQTCAPTYEFSIEIDKPGFTEGFFKTIVKIK